MVYGYCRCSTTEKKQDIARQVRELKLLGVSLNHIFLEYESGVNSDRVELNRLLNTVDTGDTIISTEVSRITRSTKQLCHIIEFAKSKGIKLIFGAFVVDCTKALDPMTQGMLMMMGVFAEIERNVISQRVKSGMANAREKGKRIGRKPTTADNLPPSFYKHYPLYQSGAINKRELARLSEVSYPTVFKYLKLIAH